MMLRPERVSKRFGGLQALNEVSFDLPEGQILGLIGPNGAGKSVLFSVINGVHRPDQGRVVFRGQDLTGLKPHHIARLGIGRAHQIVRPLNELTVRENVMVGACFGRERRTLRSGRKRADEVLDFVGLAERADQLALNLNIAQKKRLEMARALAGGPHLLLLDETLAGLNPTEVAAMVNVIRKIRDRGVTIIMVEHVMHAVMSVSERLIVLDHGQLIAEGAPEAVVKEQCVIEAYLGDPKLAERLGVNSMTATSTHGNPRNP